jgi:hypothetical protein
VVTEGMKSEKLKHGYVQNNITDGENLESEETWELGDVLEVFQDKRTTENQENRGEKL